MTLGHFFYVPGVLCLGLLIGYILGGRAAEVARADHEQQARRRAARQTARETAREPAQGGDEPGRPGAALDAGGRAAADKPPAP
jgi:hypothetical protein